MTLFRGRPTTLAVAQIHIDPGNRDGNQRRASALLTSAAERGADLVCLPGAFATGLNFPTLRTDATPLDGPVVEFLSERAGTLQVHVVAGVILADGRDVFDAALLVGPSGEVLGCYRRASLWAGEADFVSPGEPTDVIDTPVGRIGLLAGHDLRFPEAGRHHVHQGVEIVVCTANVFAPYSHAVRSICRARAADNECTFVLASGAGENRLVGMAYLGRSMIVDGLVHDADAPADADILAEVAPGAGDEVIVGQVFLRQQRKVRAALPFHDDLASTWSTTHRAVCRAV